MNEEALKARENPFAVHPLIISRWSQRSMSGEAIEEHDLQAVLDAAKWAPSSYNNQPWRFLYAKRNSPSWNLFFDLLVDANKEWVKNAGVIMVICSAKNFRHNQKPSTTHSFDTGAAWMCMALEAFHRGLVVHGMEGFDYEKARTVLKIPADVQVEAMVALGKAAPKERLSPALLKREVPSSRNPHPGYTSEGTYPSAMA
jgi:nitroreductase